jgi:hypothetical protein
LCVLVAPHNFYLIFKTNKLEICRETTELWSVSDRQKKVKLFFFTHAIFRFTQRAHKTISNLGENE